MNTRLAVLCAVVAATTALAWNHEYAWHDAAAPTVAGKPGGGSLFGTGGQSEGGVQCAHCHTPKGTNPANPLKVLVTFNPALTGASAWTGSVDGFTQQAGRYAPGTNYTVNVSLLNEHFTWPDGGPQDNNFAAVFEDASGNRVGTLTTDTNITTSNCPTARPVPGPTTGTTHMYRNCDLVFSRFPATGLSGWSFTWRSPADAGVVTMFLGAVDGNGNDRTRGRDGGPDDDVVMGKVVLAP